MSSISHSPDQSNNPTEIVITPSNTTNVSDTINSKITKKIYTHWFSITILLLSFFGSFAICFIHVPGIVPLCWITMMLITAIQIVIIVLNKVNDGIGSTKEGLVMLIIFILTSLMVPLFSFNELKYIAFAVTSFALYFQELFPLFIALYYIYKYDGTLTKQDYTAAHILSENENSSYFEFFKKKENYIAFREYLLYCWALENILFVERVSILYQIILECKNKLSEATNNLKGEKIKRIQFAYLKTIYRNYRNQIDAVCCKDTNDLNDYKAVIFAICQQICGEFIEENALNQVNICYETQKELLFLLTNDSNVNKFESLHDFLCLFDDALLQIYKLLIPMYSTQFKQYLKSKNESK